MFLGLLLPPGLARKGKSREVSSRVKFLVCMKSQWLPFSDQASRCQLPFKWLQAPLLRGVWLDVYRGAWVGGPRTTSMNILSWTHVWGVPTWFQGLTPAQNRSRRPRHWLCVGHMLSFKGLGVAVPSCAVTLKNILKQNMARRLLFKIFFKKFVFSPVFKLEQALW